jgi:hypothetical protein
MAGMEKAYSNLRWLTAPAAVILPFAIVTVELAMRPILHDGAWDVVALAVGLLAGVVCFLFLPIPRLHRALILLFYLPCLAYTVIVYSLYFIGWVYDDWL